MAGHSGMAGELAWGDISLTFQINLEDEMETSQTNQASKLIKQKSA